jgi:hypothetical protein
MPWAWNYVFKKLFLSLAPVAYAYNPSYSGGRDQKDHASKPAQAVFETLFLKKPS